MLKQLRPLFPYMRKYRRGFVIGGLTVLLNNGIWILGPLVIRGGVNDLQSWHQGKLAADAMPHKLLIWALLLVAVIAVKGVFQFLTRWIMIGISRDIEFDLRNDLFRHLEQLSYSYYQRMRTGDIMARATNDLNAVRNLLGPGIMYTANTLVLSAFALAIMISISPRLTLYTYAPLPVISIVVQYFGRRIHERFERIQASFSDISARAQENFSGARIIRAFAQEDAEIASFEKANQEYIRRSLKLVRLMGMLWPTLELLLGMAVVLVLWLGGREVLLGHMSIGSFVAFNTYMVQLTWPVIALGWVINLFQRGTASMVRIQEMFEQKPEVADVSVVVGAHSKALVGARSPAPGVPDRPAVGLAGWSSADGDGAGSTASAVPIRGELEFRHLSFSYNGTQVLKDINLQIPAGSSLAIVGPTGSGKSTLVSLIPRVYDAPEGAILLDGRPIREFPLDWLRRNIGFVPQETFLFSDSVRENIAFGVETSTDAQIMEAAEGANIALDIAAFPEKYGTMVGERGITLSGGQKQRTAIARALVRDPRIMVLDDALSSVDTYTEEKILNHLREVMHGRTTIFISHRVSTVRNADRIAVLFDGRIVELGTHDELLALNGYYTGLYNKQLLEEELETV
jgi:ATP-binding cassette subfamily B multidrug efflux pump